jgi:hypothetical protein
MLIQLLLQLTLTSALAAEPDWHTCDLVHWSDLATEKKLLDAHPNVAKRSGNKLDVFLPGGKSLSFEDPVQNLGVEPIHRVISVDSQSQIVVLYEPTSESMTYRLVHLKTGSTQEVSGCPIWSQDSHYFVALHEDLESGITQNEASLWSCKDPSTPCKSIWSAEDAKHGIGGKAASWKDGSVEILLSRVQGPDGAQVQSKTVLCKPLELKPNCSTKKNWAAHKQLKH